MEENQSPPDFISMRGFYREGLVLWHIWNKYPDQRTGKEYVLKSSVFEKGIPSVLLPFRDFVKAVERGKLVRIRQ